MSDPRVITLTWVDPIPFGSDTSFPQLVGVVGVYAIRALDGGFPHPYGANSLLYLGEGDIGERLARHVNGTGDPDVCYAPRRRMCAGLTGVDPEQVVLFRG